MKKKLSYELMQSISGGSRGTSCLVGMLGAGITGQVYAGGNPAGFIAGVAVGAFMYCDVL
ncbi:hypothetical protein [Spirosoma luteolum]